MQIDAHQHFWIYEPKEYDWIDESMAALKRNFLPEDLKPELLSHGFGGSVVVQARQALQETSWLLELADRSPNVHRSKTGLPCGCMFGSLSDQAMRCGVSCDETCDRAAMTLAGVGIS